MTIKLPINGQWTQPNNSDKFGSIWASKNINLDEDGYVKLSPRSVSVMSETENADFGIPVAIGRWNDGSYIVATSSNAVFDGSMDTVSNTWTENSGTNEPTTTTLSHGCFFNGLWHASSSTAVFTRSITGGATATWTSQITGLTSGVRHYIVGFPSRPGMICVSNGNVVKQYDATNSYAASVDVTIPADYEIIGMAYNNARMAILTRLGSSSYSQSQQSRLFIWNGATTGAQSDAAIESDAGVCVCAYKSSFVILTRTGRLLYWNGGGFDELASLPFYYQDKIWGATLSNITIGESMIADGDVIYINLGTQLNDFERKLQDYMPNAPSGVWCYDPKKGLYHRWSPSISTASMVTVLYTGIDTGTNIFTKTTGTIPATGGIVHMTNSAYSIGGIDDYRQNTLYYVIKVSATEFKLATTYDNAIAGTAIDITSAPASGTSYFWMFDIKDYGNSFTSPSNTGSIVTTGNSREIYQDVVFGGDYKTTAGVNNDTICMVVPFLENRGWIVTPKIFSPRATDTTQRYFIKFRPLGENDSIIVKERTTDVFGLPTVSGGLIATWTSDNEFYTSQDCSEAMNYLNGGNELEVEFISGAGGNQCVQVTSISTDGTTYAFVLAENVIGASSLLKSEFVLQNWKKIATITSADNGNGYKEIGVNRLSKWSQLKVEMRGWNITIEDILIDNKVNN